MKIKTNPSAKEIYFWNLLGNLAAAAVSVIYLLIVTRLQSAKISDQYSLAMSIGNLWVIIGLFQVRNYQGTDVKKHHSFDSYFLTRMLTILIMILTIIPYLRLVHYDMSCPSLLIMLLLLLYRISDAFSDLFQGLFQQEERLDIAGKSMVYRYSLSIIILFVGLLFSKSLIFSLLILGLFNIFFIIIYDYQFSKNFVKINLSSLFVLDNLKNCFQIIKICFPLFFYGFVLNQIFNEPRLVIALELQKGLLKSGLQRDYNILFMPVFFMSLCVLVIRPLITELSKCWYEKNLQKFDSIVKKLLIMLLGLGIIVTTAAFFIGVPILSLIFGINLSDNTLALTILVFSGILYSVALVFENILTIFRKHSYLIVVYILMFIVSKCITKFQVETNGILGAAISFMIVMFIYMLGSFGIFIWIRKRKI